MITLPAYVGCRRVRPPLYIGKHLVASASGLPVAPLHPGFASVARDWDLRRATLSEGGVLNQGTGGNQRFFKIDDATVLKSFVVDQRTTCYHDAVSVDPARGLIIRADYSGTPPADPTEEIPVGNRRGGIAQSMSHYNSPTPNDGWTFGPNSDTFEGVQTVHNAGQVCLEVWCSSPLRAGNFNAMPWTYSNGWTPANDLGFDVSEVFDVSTEWDLNESWVAGDEPAGQRSIHHTAHVHIWHANNSRRSQVKSSTYHDQSIFDPGDNFYWKLVWKTGAADNDKIVEYYLNGSLLASRTPSDWAGKVHVTDSGFTPTRSDGTTPIMADELISACWNVEHQLHLWNYLDDQMRNPPFGWPPAGYPRWIDFATPLDAVVRRIRVSH